jgi:hypothetical protein
MIETKAFAQRICNQSHTPCMKHICMAISKRCYVKLLALSIISSGLMTTAAAVNCDMNKNFKQADRDAKGGYTSVWASREGNSLLFISPLNINTDGTRRSYSVEDFWGEKVALNNLCNAMRDECAGLSEGALRDRRLITQQAFKKGWPADQLKKTMLSPAIIPFKHGKPCPTVDGFLVSATALHKPKIIDVCDINNYVDALVTPAVVLPKDPAQNKLSQFTAKNARIGDLVVAMVPNSEKPVYAVIGDTGRADKLGEGSLALNGRLLGRNGAPKNYYEARGKAGFKGKEWVVPKAIVLIFPGTRDMTDPYLTPKRIDEMGRKIFENWGGIERLNACVKAYGRE